MEKGEKTTEIQRKFLTKKDERTHKNNNTTIRQVDKRIVKEKSKILANRSSNEDQQITTVSEIDINETIYPTEYDCLGDGIEVDVDPVDDLVIHPMKRKKIDQ